MRIPQHNTINDFEPENFLSSFFRTAKAILFSPRPFYEGMKSEGGLRNPFIFLSCCVLIHALIVGMFVKNQIVIALNVLNGIAMPFLTAGIVFFIVTRLFKASGTYEAAFRVNAYSAATVLFSWIPLLGFFLEVYRYYLIALGLGCTFSIKISRAFLAIAITLCIYVAAFSAIAYITGGQWQKSVP